MDTESKEPRRFTASYKKYFADNTLYLLPLNKACELLEEKGLTELSGKLQGLPESERFNMEFHFVLDEDFSFLPEGETKESNEEIYVRIPNNERFANDLENLEGIRKQIKQELRDEYDILSKEKDRLTKEVNKKTLDFVKKTGEIDDSSDDDNKIKLIDHLGYKATFKYDIEEFLVANKEERIKDFKKWNKLDSITGINKVIGLE